MYSSTCIGRPHAHHQELNNCSSSLWFYHWSVVVAVLLNWPDHDQQHCYHHAPTVKPEAATAVVVLLLMGVRTPETYWAVHKRPVINLRNIYTLGCKKHHDVISHPAFWFLRCSMWSVRVSYSMEKSISASVKNKPSHMVNVLKLLRVPFFTIHVNYGVHSENIIALHWSVPWIRWLIASLWLQRPGFNPMSVCVTFMADTVAPR
jgi:hypothetical protein